MYYVVAKIQGYTLLNVDMLPLQGEHWQTDHFLFPVHKFVQPCGQASEGVCQEDVTTWGDPEIRNEETHKRFCGQEFS